MKYKLIKGLTAVALFICVVTGLLTVQEHTIFYQEQHSLFLFAQDYVQHTFHSEGISALVADFMVQFYHIPWLGASIVGLILTLIYLLTEGIIRNLLGCRDILQTGVILAVGLYFTLDGIEESPAPALFTMLALAALWGVSFIFRKQGKGIKPLKRWQFAMLILLPAVYIYGGLMLEMKGYDRSERAMILADKAIKEKNWDEAKRITEHYLNGGRENRLMLYLRSIALAEKGILVDSLFNCRQTAGLQALAFPWRSDSRESEYGHMVHEITGDINAAHHWAFEAMTVWGETAPHLLNLARYNVALGRPKVALHFADRLGESLFYKAEADKIRRQVRGEEKPELRCAVPDSIFVKWVNIEDFRPNIMQNYMADTTSNITREYLIASMLLSNNLRPMIPLLKKEDIESENIREAMLIYSLDPEAKPLSEFGLKVDERTGERFHPFYSLLKRGDTSEMQQSYGKSFWYYIHILKPQTRK